MTEPGSLLSARCRCGPGPTGTTTDPSSSKSGYSQRWSSSRASSIPGVGAIRTTAASPSTTTRCSGASTIRSPAPARGSTTATTARTVSSRTGPSPGAPPATRVLNPWREVVLNQIWSALPPLTNLFTPKQELISETRVGAKVTQGPQPAKTPYQRLQGHPEQLDDHDDVVTQTRLVLTPEPMILPSCTVDRMYD